MLVMSHRPGLSGLVLLRLLLRISFFWWSCPQSGLVLGRGTARFRLVLFGGHQVRKVRGNAADAHDAADVFLYRDSSIAPLLVMRRRFRAVLSVLDSMISHGVTLSRSVELTAQWGKTLRAVESSGLGDFHRVVCDVHHRLSDFIHGIVVHRRDEATRRQRNWIRGGQHGAYL